MMCELCSHALGDDHNEVGVCLKCCLHGGPCFNPIGAPLPPKAPAWVMLWAFANGVATPVEMLGVTTMEYAAKRIAEAAQRLGVHERTVYRIIAREKEMAE